MSIQLYYFIGVGLIFLTRIIINLILKEEISSDTYYHLLISNQIRNNHWKIPHKFNNFYDDKFRSPVFFAYFISLFPDKIRLKLINYSGALFDSLNLTLLYWLLRTLGLLNQNNAILLILFAIYPAFTSFYPGPRTYKATPRIIVELLNNFYFVMLFLFQNKQNYYLLLVLIIIGVLILNTGKFGLQTLILFSIILGIKFFSPIILLLPIFVAGLTILTNRSYYNVLVHQIQHLTLLAKRLQYTSPLITKREESVLSAFKKKGIVGVGEKLLFNSDWFNFFIKNYLITIFIVSILITKKFSWVINDYFAWWLIAGVFWFLITSTKHVRFLGESERYLLFSTIPLFILLPRLNFNQLTYIIFLIFEIVFFLGIIFTSILINKQGVSNVLENPLFEVFHFLKKLRSHKNIKLLPILHPGLNLWELVFETDVFIAASMGLDGVYRKYILDINQPIKNLDLYFKQYPFTHVLLEKCFQKRYSSLKNKKKYKKLFENKLYIIYERIN